MKIFAGLSRTDYEDVFRAVGALIDERGWSNVSLMEVDEGLVVQVMIKPDQRETRPRLETYLLTDADLERVLRDAVMRRRKRELELRAAQPPASAATTPPPPSKLIEGVLASKGDQGGEAVLTRSAQPAPPPAPPIRPSNGNGESSHDAASEFSEIASQIARIGQSPLGHASHLPVLAPRTGRSAPPLPTAMDDDDVTPLDATPFDPAPMRLSNQPPGGRIDTGAARAAVVMAHIVAARLKSGVPMTSDDPDLASLLEQVRALDQGDVGEKG
jgi:hypothetical protein